MIRLFELMLEQEVAAFENKSAMWKWLKEKHPDDFGRIKYFPGQGVLVHLEDEETFRSIYEVRVEK